MSFKLREILGSKETGSVPGRTIPLDGYRRALRFIVPYWPRLLFVLLIGVAATGSGLLQPYISKILIDDALLKRNLRMLLLVSGLMFGLTVIGFVLNILSSYQYVRVSASVLFDMRLALYRHLQTLSPRFWASASRVVGKYQGTPAVCQS